MKGLLALDIDGTITIDHHAISPTVIAFFTSLKNENWQFMFVTGRPFPWGYSVLRHLNFPYYFAVQNGATILAMPSREILLKKYLNKQILPTMEEICQGEASDFVVYGGYEFGDRCFFRPEHFDPPLLSYLKKRCSTLGETWEPLQSFEDLPLSEFSSVKCFGDFSSAQRIGKKIEQKLGLHIPIIRDPFDARYYVAQATHPLVHKGQAVKDIKALLEINGPVIAAGDDYNDCPMLEIADFKVVMATAPREMLSTADVVAPPAAEEGIIQGLKEAINKVKGLL
jgi:Cof subfamily protein (haloacid dehalogenase superfamily)